tara:strand:+ start:2297 stop:3145 length:849 start_codon:yes stop_codon:yes gene_type:complete
MIIFNGSMPRAGSTLMQNILGNHPEFYVSPTSVVMDMIYEAHAQHTRSVEIQAQGGIEKNAEALYGFFKGAIEGYYKPLTDKPYIVDKSRGWNMYIDVLKKIYNKPKIICMVRHPFGILSSMEKAYRRNPHVNKQSVNTVSWAQMRGTTVNKRIDGWLESQPVGLAFDRLYDAILRGWTNAEDILFVRFEDLTTNPEETMKKVHWYLEIPDYNYDFKNIKQVTEEDDNVHGIYGDHNIRSEIKPIEENPIEILSLNGCLHIQKRLGWFMEYFNYDKITFEED